MKTLRIDVFFAFLIAVCLSGCAYGPPDPLLYGEDGELRTSVSQLEVDEAGIPRGCDDLEGLDADDVVVVPVVDGDREPVLLGIGGQAYCVSDEDDNEDEGLPVVDIEDDTGLDADTPLTMSDSTGNGTSGIAVVDVSSHHTGQVPGQQPTVLQDPTPEPAGD